MIKKIIEKAKAENKEVYIFAHKFPDGDAISSSCALVEYLKNNNIEAKYVVTNLINPYTKILGENISTTQQIDKDAIAIIVDTRSVDYAENKMFLEFKPENTYIIDHHMKSEGNLSIEDEINIPKENVIRNPEASSTCEILIGELEKEKITKRCNRCFNFRIINRYGKIKIYKARYNKKFTKIIRIRNRL